MQDIVVEHGGNVQRDEHDEQARQHEVRRAQGGEQIGIARHQVGKG